MLFRSGLLVVFIISVFPATTVDAQPYSEPFGTSSILARSNPGMGDNLRHPLDTFIAGGGDCDQRIKVFISQTSQITDEPNQPGQENLTETKERLEQRKQSLTAQGEAIKKEEEALDKIGRGGTLRGSKAKKFMKKMEDFNRRVTEYNEKVEKFHQDIEAYEAAVKAKETAVQEDAKESVQPQPAPQ